MCQVCEKYNVKLLTYGSLVGQVLYCLELDCSNQGAWFQCGGFLADKWLNTPEPDVYSEAFTPSSRK